MTGYIETGSDFAFTAFLQMISPADMSDSEYRLFRYYRVLVLGK